MPEFILSIMAVILVIGIAVIIKKVSGRDRSGGGSHAEPPTTSNQPTWSPAEKKRARASGLRARKANEKTVAENATRFDEQAKAFRKLNERNIKPH
jgi:hypothetical protein